MAAILSRVGGGGWVKRPFIAAARKCSLMTSWCRNAFRITLLWRHNERDSFSNHKRLYRLLKRLFRRRSNITSKLLAKVTGQSYWPKLLAKVRGIHRSPVNSAHKGQWRGKCFHLMTSSCYGPFWGIPLSETSDGDHWCFFIIGPKLLFDNIGNWRRHDAHVTVTSLQWSHNMLVIADWLIMVGCALFMALWLNVIII